MPFPSDMTAPPAGALPPLPEPDFLSGNCNVGESAYTADQMREYTLLAALRLREGWRPIESAPMEGEFLVYMPEERTKIQVAKWRPNVKVIGSTFAFDLTNPTHWMPLPAPPTADDLARVLEEGR